MQDQTTLLPLLERVYADAISLAAVLTPDDLERSTICRGWNVRALVNHYLSGTRELSRAAASLPAEHLEDDLIGADPADQTERMLAEARALWRRPEAWEGGLSSCSRAIRGGSPPPHHTDRLPRARCRY